MGVTIVRFVGSNGAHVCATYKRRIDMSVSRRSFLGGAAATLGTLGSGVDLFAQGGQRQPAPGAPRERGSMDDYDMIAHLSSNENCWGPPESVLKAMTQGFKYANRYGYPGGDVQG